MPIIDNDNQNIVAPAHNTDAGDHWNSWTSAKAIAPIPPMMENLV